ncbi:hypothetical protein CELD12_19520 [Cellulomonas sp. NTE-D12]|nr:hypothetical protein CELD12_19520 [Cellulomonas sp. NTE-D12]
MAEAVHQHDAHPLGRRQAQERAGGGSSGQVDAEGAGHGGEHLSERPAEQLRLDQLVVGTGGARTTEEMRHRVAAVAADSLRANV